MKRLFDIVLALCALIILSPILAAAALAVLICSGRPIFYVQERVGKGGRIFRIIKFRTMVRDADELKATLLSENEAPFPFFKIKNDSRITQIGRILRRTSIDELPQLFCVLRGDMSIVGPRPVLKEEAEHLDALRFTVHPGLTGPTQIYRGVRITPSERAMLESEYILAEHRLLTDMRIILATVRVVFRGE